MYPHFIGLSSLRHSARIRYLPLASPAKPGVGPGRKISMLTAKQVERIKTPGRHACGLVKGLYLQIGKDGARSWVLRYQLRGHERMMGLGSAATFTLKEARERARLQRQLLADRIDPLVGKRAAEEAAKLAAARKLSFREAAERYFDQHAGRWRPSHRDMFLTTLRAHAFPTLGAMDVASIDTPD